MAEWSSATSMAERIAALRQTIPTQVRIIAVSKTFPAQCIREAYAAGLRDFAESRLQEAIAKQAQLADLSDITWHFIGHLQRNKAKQTLLHFSWIHSVDSLALAQRLNDLARGSSVAPDLCLQVKLRTDPQKYGWTSEELMAALPSLCELKYLNLCGLMTILPLGLTPAAQLLAFQELKAIAQTIQKHPTYPLPLVELSMGMSQDYPLATQAGATMIRLGRILFGNRAP
jgi:PLP dependent protein